MDKSAIDQLLAFDDDDDDEEESEEDDAEVRRHRRDFDGRMERALLFKQIYPHASSMLCSDNAHPARSFSPEVLRWR